MKLKYILIIALVILGGWYLYSVNSGTGTSLRELSCTTNTVASAAVGADISSTILSAYSNRAWARIERVDDSAGVATNTVHVSFDAGSAATLTSGLTLGTTTQFIDFGKNTDFPYVGAVTGITDVGSTTVRITSCRY